MEVVLSLRFLAVLPGLVTQMLLGRGRRGGLLYGIGVVSENHEGTVCVRCQHPRPFTINV